MGVKLQTSILEKPQYSSNLLHSPTIPDFDPTLPPAVLAIDTECTGLRWATNHYPFAISMAWYDRRGSLQTAWYDWPVDPITRQPVYGRCEGLNRFNNWFTNPNIIKVFANAKFDLHMIKKAFGLRVNGRVEDVLLAAWCCNTLEPSFKLNDLAEKYVGIDQGETKILKDTVKQTRTAVKNAGLPYSVGPDYSVVGQDYWLPKCLDHSSSVAMTYGIKDAVRTLKLYDFYKEGLFQLGNQLAYERELKVLHKIFNMEERGIRLYIDKCKEELSTLEKTILEVDKEILSYSNKPVNTESPKQLIKLIFGEQVDKSCANAYRGGIICKDSIHYVYDLTETSQPSTSAPTFLKLKDQHPIFDLILQKRGAKKGIALCKNYLSYAIKDPNVSSNDLPFLNQKCIKPTFNQISSHYDKENKTITGRLSSSDPNLQNVADALKSGGVYVTDARELFGPRTGYNWYCIDYNQLELRIFAERTGGALKDAFLQGRDPHNETRVRVPFLAAMPKEKGRKIAKNTNFTLINCGGAGVLNKKYGIPLEEGKIILEQFHQEFTETRKRQKIAERFAINHGYIETLFNRKIAVDLTRKGGKYLYSYRATAYDVQGSAADIIKLAMIKCDNWLTKVRNEKRVDAHLVLSIHDELIFEIRHQDSYKWLLKGLVYIMENVAKNVMEIPLQCEIEKRKISWSSRHKEKVNL